MPKRGWIYAAVLPLANEPIGESAIGSASLSELKQEELAPSLDGTRGSQGLPSGMLNAQLNRIFINPDH